MTAGKGKYTENFAIFALKSHFFALPTKKMPSQKGKHPSVLRPGLSR